MGAQLRRIANPSDVRSLSGDQLRSLAAEIRELLVDTMSRTGGHLGPNLGIVELTIALHRVFDSPHHPILFDVGHQAYVHKILTGRADQLATLRQAGGLSGYPSRAESVHDWIENSHASTALSYADGLAKAFEASGERRPVVAVVGDGALTGGMCWEALNNIAASDRPVVIVVNDNGRSYAPTSGGVATRLAALRLRPGYERALRRIKRRVPDVPLVGTPVYRVMHGAKRGIKDLFAPQGLFEDLGLKYVGPVDGHDVNALHSALELARDFGGPVIVHCVTVKGHGYRPAEDDVADHMHQTSGFDPVTGLASTAKRHSWTNVFAEEMVRIGAERGDVVAISAAMRDSTGLGGFAHRYPERFFDVGIAEQHALTSAAGLAMGGLHPVVAVYATFMNRAFDQLLMDVALHGLAVTVVLDRAGITGDDGPSHNGMWDLALLAVVPGLHVAAPRDEATLRAELTEAVARADGPTVIRFPKTPLPDDIGALRTVGTIEVLVEPGPQAHVDALLVAVGSCAGMAVAAGTLLRQAGYSVRVVDPRWVMPFDPALVELAAHASVVVTVEDGIVVGGVGSRLSQLLRDEGCEVTTLEIGIPCRFLDQGKVADIHLAAGLTGAAIAARVSALCQQVGVTGLRRRGPGWA